MSWICLSDNKKCKARKAHDCSVCNEMILPGEEQVTRSGVEPGEGYYRMHMHPDCEMLSTKWTSDDWESFDPGSMTHDEVRAQLLAPVIAKLEHGMNSGGVR